MKSAASLRRAASENKDRIVMRFPERARRVVPSSHNPNHGARLDAGLIVIERRASRGPA